MKGKRPERTTGSAPQLKWPLEEMSPSLRTKLLCPTKSSHWQQRMGCARIGSRTSLPALSEPTFQEQITYIHTHLLGLLLPKVTHLSLSCPARVPERSFSFLGPGWWMGRHARSAVEAFLPSHRMGLSHPACPGQVNTGQGSCGEGWGGSRDSSARPVRPGPNYPLE